MTLPRPAQRPTRSHRIRRLQRATSSSLMCGRLPIPPLLSRCSTRTPAPPSASLTSARLDNCSFPPSDVLGNGDGLDEELARARLWMSVLIQRPLTCRFQTF
ncbi:hypothetical protein OTU49_001343 [Cherax quadricarinatus]|uniref:Uncharacterized protein n=1 Tax=Cherax quadricarinatus TaxID=27406 RepID=A0AAW0XS30_CHEQU